MDALWIINAICYFRIFRIIRKCSIGQIFWEKIPCMYWWRWNHQKKMKNKEPKDKIEKIYNPNLTKKILLDWKISLIASPQNEYLKRGQIYINCYRSARNRKTENSRLIVPYSSLLRKSLLRKSLLWATWFICLYFLSSQFTEAI